MVLHQNNSLFSSRFSPPAKDATLRYLQKFSNEVKILTVKTSEDKDCTEEEMENAAIEYASTLPKLVRLDVGGTIYDKNLFRSLLRLKHLRHLSVDVSDLVLEQEFNHISPSILTLQLDSEDGPEAGELVKLVSRCPGIQSLSLKLSQTCMNLDDNCLLALAKGLPHLRILRILYEVC
jgi:hypothetical protein